MAPFTAWLPVRSERPPDLIMKVAGGGVTSLMEGVMALGCALADQGFEVMSQTTRLGRSGPHTAVQLRVAMDPLTSMGTGCDVAAYVDREVLQNNWFSLQPGSVLFHEAGNLRLWPVGAVPEGVITYPVPFSDLESRCNSRFPGKVLIAIGIMSRLFGVSEAAVRNRIKNPIGLRCFDAGARFASAHLDKRDIFSLPAPATGRRRIMLDARQAFLLGATIGSCHCRRACAPTLDRSPDEWMAEHTSAAWRRDALLMKRNTHSAQVYRKSGGRVAALIGTEDPTTIMEKDVRGPQVVLVASDLLETIRLVELARRLARKEARYVSVVVDDVLANRRHSIPLEKLVEIVRGVERGAEATYLRAEREGNEGANVGYVAWGTAQGVVREAIAICRGFGLKVAALYPKVLRPVPTQDLEAFAATVESLVIVEPHRAGRYTKLVRASTSVRCTTLVPESRWGLTPMDIFLREGLGA